MSVNYNFLFKLSNRILIFILIIFGFFVSLNLFYGKKVYAYFNTYDSTCATKNANNFSGTVPRGGVNVPTFAYNYLNRADCNENNPTVITFITVPGTNQSSTATVIEGTTSIDLNFTAALTVGKSNNGVVTTQYTIVSSSSGITGLSGNIQLTPGSSNYRTPGYSLVQGKPFKYAPSGGFTSSTTYTVNINLKVVNLFTNGSYLCVANGASTSNLSGASCPNTQISAQIRVNVNPPQLNSTCSSRVITSQIYPNTRFEVEIEMKNTGSNTWDSNYRLGSATGQTDNYLNALGVDNSITIPTGTSVPPGGIYTFSINRIAPAAVGYYQFQWKMARGTTWFGQVCGPTIQVIAPPPDVSCSIENNPGPNFDAQYEPGASITPRVKTERNTNVGSPDILINVKLYINNIEKTLNPSIFNLTTTDNIKYSDSTVFTFGESDLNPGIVTISGEYTYTLDGVSTTRSCNKQITVAKKPFFKVTNGDLSVGGGYDSGCTAAGSGNVYSWAGTTNTSGANSSHAAKIFGTALEYYSGSKFNTVNDKKYLTLANSSGDWGGNFGAGTCMTDLYDVSDSPTPPSNPYTPENVAARKQYVGNLTLNEISTFTGQNALYVTGNVYITGDIINSSLYNYSVDPTTGELLMPIFALIVKGNIYISPSVIQLDGVYIAQPKDDGTGGTIYTCANGFNEVPKENIYTQCNNKLDFNGVVQAKSIKLHRVNGTLRDNTPAETFNGLPELYLAKTPFVDNTPSSTKYDSASLLPPLL